MQHLTKPLIIIEVVGGWGFVVVRLPGGLIIEFKISTQPNWWITDHFLQYWMLIVWAWWESVPKHDLCGCCQTRLSGQPRWVPIGYLSRSLDLCWFECNGGLFQKHKAWFHYTENDTRLTICSFHPKPLGTWAAATWSKSKGSSACFGSPIGNPCIYMSTKRCQIL